ncbi:hypothetical protein QZH41_004134 [Actinostola sp. cb2023]|nr:hypothetical protein QZH41_004134 [Actinostola sp. cb2023]
MTYTFHDDYEFVLATRETFQLAYKRTALVFVVLAVRNSYKDGTAFIEPVGRDYGGRCGEAIVFVLESSIQEMGWIFFYCNVSYDVNSLFTEIPLNETIDYIIHEIYDVNTLTPITSKTIFKRLLERVTKVDKLERKTAKSIVKRLKRHFSNHGIPNELFSDNGPPFDSHEFREFANDYEFTLTTSSPNYPQSNGRVENAVKTAKRLMKKTKEAGTDFYLALLDWRNTPTEGVNSSLAQRLYGRRTRTLLPTSATLLKPKIPHNVRDKLLVKKELQTKYYNRHTRELPPLTPGDQVRIIPKPNDRSTKWTKAEVEEQVDSNERRRREFLGGPLGSPVFANQDSPSYISVYKNHDITLKCEAVGDTPITITWMHKDSFEVCRTYHSLFNDSRQPFASTSYVNDDSSFDESVWYIFKDKHGFNRIPTTCVPQYRCGATAPGYMQGALPSVNEGIVKRKACFHSKRNCCHNSVDIYVRNCYMFYVYNLKKLDLSWKARYCAEYYINGKSPELLLTCKGQRKPDNVLNTTSTVSHPNSLSQGPTKARYCAEYYINGLRLKSQ